MLSFSQNSIYLQPLSCLSIERDQVYKFESMKFAGRIIVVLFLVFQALLGVGCSPHNTGKKESLVEKNGQLAVKKTFIVNCTGEPVSLRGMGLFWSQWGDEYYNSDCIQWLRDDWNCQVVRAAIATGKDGYADGPQGELEKVKRVIDACIDLGIYVLVDWHSHHAEEEVDLAIEFFEEIASRYGEHPNIIYEIYNEPERTSWSHVVKPYAETLIQAIRRIDPDNIIVVGSSHWAQDVDSVAIDPLDFNNIAYSLHFYAATHKQWLRDKATVAIDSGLALWVTEFGTCESNGDGPIDYKEMEKWFDFMKKHKISCCNWSVSDKKETSAALKPGADVKGGWPESMLTESGNYIRKKMKTHSNSSE